MGCHALLKEIFLTQGSNHIPGDPRDPRSPALQADSLPSEPPGKCSIICLKSQSLPVTFGSWTHTLGVWLYKPFSLCWTTLSWCRNLSYMVAPMSWVKGAYGWLIWKDPDAGKDWGQEEKGTIEDEMVAWHHRLNGHGFGWTLGVGDGQGSLVCCSSWGRKESDTTEQLNWTDGYLQGCQLQNVWDKYPKEFAHILIHGFGYEYPMLWDCTNRKVTSGLHCHSCNPTRAKNQWEEIISYTSANQAEVCRIRSCFLPGSQYWVWVNKAWEIRTT